MSSEETKIIEDNKGNEDEYTDEIELIIVSQCNINDINGLYQSFGAYKMRPLYQNEFTKNNKTISYIIRWGFDCSEIFNDMKYMQCWGLAININDKMHVLYANKSSDLVCPKQGWLPLKQSNNNKTDTINIAFQYKKKSKRKYNDLEWYIDKWEPMNIDPKLLKDVIENESEINVTVNEYINNLSDDVNNIIGECYDWSGKRLKYAIKPNENGPNMILNGIYIGNMLHASIYPILKLYNIKYLLNMSNSINIVYPTKLIGKHVEIIDTPTHAELLYSHLDDCVEFIQKAITNKCNIFVHCMSGCSRAPTPIIAYLIKYKNMDYNEAYNYISNKRPLIRPNSGFVGALIKYRESCQKKTNSITNNDNNTTMDDIKTNGDNTNDE